MLRNILRRLHNKKEIGFALVALLAISALPLPAHAESVTLYPTTNTEIFGTWSSPENAYANDGVYTDSFNYLAEQSYGGFGFNIPSDAENLTVYLTTRFYYLISSWLSYTLAGYIVGIFDGSGISTYIPLSIENEGADTGASDKAYATVSFDVSSVVSHEDLENASFNVRIINAGDNDDTWLFVDFVSVTVFYDRPAVAGESELPVGLAIGGLFAGFIGVMVLAIKRKR